MAVKFLSFRPDPMRPMQLQDKTKWQSSDGRTFKLLSPNIETDKQFAYGEIKSSKALQQGERLVINGIANANIIDRMQERLDPRGIEVDDYMKNSMLLAHHSYYHPIGQVDAIEIQEDGIHFSGWIGDPGKAELTPMQKEIRSLVAQGILKTVSVGFIPKKVRAPLYNDQGIMTEPCVIEAWELLELSVVAVPCNQDSVFQMRNLDSESNSAKMIKEVPSKQSLNDSLIKKGLEAILEENMVVQTLIFDKDVFTIEQASDWAKNHGFSSEAIEETDTSYRLSQRDAKDFDPDSLRELNIMEGVNAVAGKTNSTEGKAPEDSAPADMQQQMLTLLQQLSEGQKRVVEMCDLMLKKLEAKPSEDEGGGKPEDEGSEKPEDEGKALEARLANLEKGFDKLVKSVSLLVENISK